MSNANYTRIQAHGTASAFEPSFINRAATVGPPQGPVQPDSPYKVLDATVDLTGAVTDQIFPIGEIPPGCFITAVYLNSNGTLDVDNLFSFGFYDGFNTFLNVAEFEPTNVPPGDSGEPNGGQVLPAYVVVPKVQPLLPAIKLSTANPNPIVLPASVSVTVLYHCP